MIRVVAASEADLSTLTALAAARDRFYAAEGPRRPSPDAAIRRERIRAALFSPQPAAAALLALDGETPVGALYFARLFPGVEDRLAYFVKDLFVLEAARGRGAGRALVLATMARARAENADRLELHVHCDNAGATAFYTALGLARLEDRAVWRVPL